MNEEVLNNLFELRNLEDDKARKYTLYRKIEKQITDIQQENKQLKNILSELEEWLCGEKIVLYNVDGKVGILRGDILNKIQELKEKYK